MVNVRMVLSIKIAEANEPTRQLARETGESVTTAITEALRERLAAVRRRRTRKDAVNRIAQIARSRTVLDARSDDEIVGYDAVGAPNRWSWILRRS
jgi:antitoxin VapB